jgi:hypothetical protein
LCEKPKALRLFSEGKSERAFREMRHAREVKQILLVIKITEMRFGAVMCVTKIFL